MGKQNRYGISVQFSCKFCTVSNFQTVEDYIEHKKESHATEFRKRSKCLIVLEEKTLPVPITYTYTYYYENEKTVDSLQVKNFDCHEESNSLAPTSTVIKEEKNNDENDEEDPLSTKTTDDDLPSPSSSYDDTGPGHKINENQNLISSSSPGSSDPLMKDNDQLNFQCKLCLRTFNSEPQWKNHSNICGLYYKNGDSYCCALCNDLFSDANALKHHLSTSHTKTISESEESIKTENVSSQYHSELEEAPAPVVDEPEEAAEYIIADNDSLQETPPSSPSPSPSPSKKMKPNFDSEPPRRGLRRPPEINKKLYPKPLFTYSSLIFLALKNSRTGSLRVGQMYKFVSRYFPYFHSTNNSWKNSLRHNLSCNNRFRKAKKPPAKASATGSSNGTAAQREKNNNRGLWEVKPSLIQNMDHQVKTQLSRHVNVIRSSLRVPENLELMQRGELNEDFEDDSDFSDEDKDVEDLPATNRVSASPQPSVSGLGKLRQRKQSYLGKTKSLNNSKSCRKSQAFPIGTHLSRFRTILPKVNPNSKSNDDLSQGTSQDNSKTSKEDYIVPNHNNYEDEGDVSLKTSSGRSRKQILDVAATRRFNVDSEDFSFLDESQFSPSLEATRPRPNILTKKMIRVKAECQRPLMALMETSDFGFGKIVKVQGNYLCKPGK